MSASKTWSVTDAKAHLREVIDCALREGPQSITRRGRNAVVIVSADEWKRLTQEDAAPGATTPKASRKGTLSDFFRNSPLYDSWLDLDRVRDELRDISKCE